MEYSINQIVKTFFRLSSNLTDEKFQTNPLNLHIVCQPDKNEMAYITAIIISLKICEIAQQIKANEIPYESIKKDFPKIQRFYPAIGEIRAVELNEYAKAVGIDVQENIQEDMQNIKIWQHLSAVGFCIYHVDNKDGIPKHTIYIGFPYTAEEDTDKMEPMEISPLERAIRLEMERYQQEVMLKNTSSELKQTSSAQMSKLELS